jgi:predicted DNA-binding protein
MTKPKLIDWLETETGQDLSPTSPVGKTRHVSVRMPDDLYERLENAARQDGATVSEFARRLLEVGLTPPDAPAAAIDEAIDALRRARPPVAGR